MTDEEIKQAVEEAANDNDVGAKHGLTKKDVDMSPEEIKQASDDMNKQTEKVFTSDRMKQLGRFINAPVMSTVNELATPDYDKKRYTDQVMGIRTDADKAKDAARDISYGAGTVTSDALINGAISKLLGKMGLGPATVDERESRKAIKTNDESKLKHYNKGLEDYALKHPEQNERGPLWMRHEYEVTSAKNLPQSSEASMALRMHPKSDTLGTLIKESILKENSDNIAKKIGNRDEAILDTLTGTKYAKKGLDANKEYQNRNIKDPSRKTGFISSIMDSIKLAQLKDNSDKIDIERVKKEMPVDKLNNSQKEEFQGFIDNGDDEGLQKWLLSADVQDALQK